MQLENRVTSRDLWMIAVMALVGYLPFLGAAPLFDWDEINFAESAREMLVTGNYFQVQVNYEPFWEKPPLFIWLQALSMQLFGVNEFAARLPNALVGLCTLLALYVHGTRLRSRRFGLMVAAFYFISFLPFLYFKSGIIDPLFNLLIFMGLMQILRHEVAPRGEKPVAAPYLSGMWVGLATLTKGPVALLVTCLVYFIWKLVWDRKQFAFSPLLKFVGVYLLVILSWFGSILLFSADGPEIIWKFIVYQAELFSQAVAGHEQPFFYHFAVFVLGCFPLSAFAFRGMGKAGWEGSDQMLRRLMVVWFWVVLVLFSIVRTKIVHYSSMLYFPGAFLAALYLDRLWSEGRKPRWDTYLLFGLGMLLLGGFCLSVNAIGANAAALQRWSTGAFMRAALGAQVDWKGYEWVAGLVFVAGAVGGLAMLLKGRYKAFLVVMAVSNPLSINALNWLVLPRVADYSQNAAIRFFEEKAGEDCYVMVQGYKSYAHYFYGRVAPFPHPEIPYEEREGWLANGRVDKPVYMVIRVDRATAQMESWFPEFDRIGEENGFRFYKRRDPQPPQP